MACGDITVALDQVLAEEDDDGAFDSQDLSIRTDELDDADISFTQLSQHLLYGEPKLACC